MNRHLKSSHLDITELFTCNLCHKGFSRKEYVKQHQMLCNFFIFCLRSVYRVIGIANLSNPMVGIQHQNKEHNRVFSHDVVTKFYICTNGLNGDIGGLSGSKEKACPLCLKVFFDIYTMKRHLKLHQDIRELYTCAYCQKGFTQKGHLRRHEARNCRGSFQQFL
ncbi:hypothetical protein LAZ67_1001195 [Cordylochernes scorpioides]|uniref:C2H2-type domain-containing protein n=1 Tax=Cordylochernes scorpioides TaxID=51811 RepID=A0ABY6JWU0_9ARAC|nr:hypothetical protein LAZ67_1001195 [Cordylochernes scorpioides]